MYKRLLNWAMFFDSISVRDKNTEISNGFLILSFSSFKIKIRFGLVIKLACFPRIYNLASKIFMSESGFD